MMMRSVILIFNTCIIIDCIQLSYQNKKKHGRIKNRLNIFCLVPHFLEKIVQIRTFELLSAIECTGGVPYIILKPILEKATPDQLFNLEHYNPYLIEDTDELWRLHCLKEFRTKKREEMETWREMYMRCLDEREAKLNAITANIKESQDKSLPVRTTKLAYIDSVAKPPRNVARKQVHYFSIFIEFFHLLLQARRRRRNRRKLGSRTVLKRRYF